MKNTKIYLTSIIATLLSISECAQLNYLRKTVESKIPCGEEVEGYTPSSIEEIGLEKAGEKVMVSYFITNGDAATCTAMACMPSNPCCNGCSTSPKLDTINLLPTESELFMGCSGTNCEYSENCVYQDGDRVLVYGTVNSFGWTINVDQHCLDPNYTDGGKGEKIFKGENDTPTLSTTNEMCQELSSVFMIPGTVYCSMLLGVGIHMGECKYISGCSAMEYEFFDTVEDCVATCFVKPTIEEILPSLTDSNLIAGNFTNTTTNATIITPLLRVNSASVIPLDENETTTYIPLEGIRTCIENTLPETIYLSGCSVFALNSADVSYEQRQCLWEGYAVPLTPGEEYCSDYELYFREIGEYTITAEYCEEDLGLSVMFSNCQEVQSVSSESLSVNCPSHVNCMPMVQQPLWLVCGYNRDSFLEQCNETEILS